MKIGWLFLPDIFLVVGLCLTCEREEMPHLRSVGDMTSHGKRPEWAWKNNANRSETRFQMEFNEQYVSKKGIRHARVLQMAEE
jgi:hypothetical protein